MPSMRRLTPTPPLCANFYGLGPDWLRLAVRSPDLSDAVVAAMLRCTQRRPMTATQTARSTR
ncbi:MAG: hypothetical protein QM658_11865, partial [Gordonia sp. (in: high G+C Gram-positive bacteria)]